MRQFSLPTAVIAIVAAACSLSCAAETGTTPDVDNTVLVRILGDNGALSFNPNPASAGGKDVRFKNDDPVETHRVVLNDFSIDTGDIPPGATSRTFTMPSAGIFYHCSIHTGMVGSVSGQGDSPPPPCTGLYCY